MKGKVLTVLLTLILIPLYSISAQNQINFEWREDPSSLPWPSGQRMLKRIHVFQAPDNKLLSISGKLKVTNLESTGSEYAVVRLSIQVTRIDSYGQLVTIGSSSPAPWEMYKTESYFRDILVNVEVLANEKIEIWLKYEGGTRIDKKGPPNFEVDKASYLIIK